jgi:hypothetical protein
MVVIVLILMGFILMSCSSQPQKSVKFWALHYAEEQYKFDYDGYELMGYIIEEYVNVPIENDFEGEYKMFRVTFINNSGKNVIYNVLVVYKEVLFDGYLGKTFIKESSIIDYDIELVE